MRARATNREIAARGGWHRLTPDERASWLAYYQLEHEHEARTIAALEARR